MAKTLWSFGLSEYDRVKSVPIIEYYDRVKSVPIIEYYTLLNIIQLYAFNLPGELLYCSWTFASISASVSI